MANANSQPSMLHCATTHGVVSVGLACALAYVVTCRVLAAAPKAVDQDEHVVSEATEWEVVENHLLTTPVEGSDDGIFITKGEGDGATVEVAQGARPAFTAWLVRTAREEYPMLREETEANRMVVAKFLRDWCRTKGMRQGHIGGHVCRAVSLFFVADAADLFDASVRNSTCTYSLRKGVEKAHRVSTELTWLGRFLAVGGTWLEPSFTRTVHHAPVRPTKK